MKTIGILLLAVSLVACNKKEDVKKGESPLVVVNDTVNPVADSLGKQCFEHVIAKDTIKLSFDRSGDDVKGKLTFDNFEKDSSSGEVVGNFSADTLKLNYTFQSEGTTSKREVYFLKTGNSLMMGIGDMEDKNGVMCFKDHKKISYSKALVLVKTECKPE